MRHGKKAATLVAALALLAVAPAEAAVEVSPPSLTFAKQKIGTQSAPQTVKVTGGFCGPDFIDPVMMVIVPGPCFPEPTSVAVSGQFVIVQNTCPATLLSPTTTKASCSISVAFKPTAKGARQGFLRAQSSPSILGASLSGTGCKKKKAKGHGKKKKRAKLSCG